MLGAEGEDGDRFAVSSPLEVFTHGTHRYIVVRQRVQVFAHQHFIASVLVVRELLRGNRVRHQHAVVRDRSGLIDAERVDSGQRLNALHVVEHDLALCQKDGTCRQRDAHQKVEALRDHADDCRDHTDHAFVETVTLRYITLQEQCDADRNDHNACRNDDLVDGAYHLRLFAGRHFPCFEHELGNVGVVSYSRELCDALAGDHKASRHQLISCSLDDLIRLTGEERFVYSRFSLQHHSVRRDLVAALEDDHVAQDQLVDGNLHPLAVADCNRVGLIQNAQSVQHLLGVQLLEDTDQHVCDDHRQESQAVEGARYDQQQADDQEDQVEICKYVFFDNVLGRLRSAVHLHIDLAAGSQVPHLRGFQSVLIDNDHLRFLKISCIRIRAAC